MHDKYSEGMLITCVIVGLIMIGIAVVLTIATVGHPTLSPERQDNIPIIVVCLVFGLVFLVFGCVFQKYQK